MKKIALCVTAALSLSACATMNNGTSTGNPNSVTTYYPIEATILNIYTKPRSQNLVAVVDDQHLSAEIRVTPKGTMVFNNQQVQGAEVNTINKSNNQVVSQSVSINYFTPSPLTFHGFTNSSGEYSVSTQTTAIPKLAQVGEASPLITETVYSDSSQRKKIGVYNQSWSLLQDSNQTAWFCINSSANALLAVDPNGSASECYKINAKGDILDSRLTLQVPTDNGIQTINFNSK